ncbi:hypothetical protein RJ640_015363 [Escallonia rubra]|uniref:Uncharacterized protein n=1 Tax=Escallonia rubra TaxID=112253 RepID=A0AA88U1H0_9ASTE|nr:hypothetical protein RJ640_015363 [Escallonia rubra]
MAKGKPRPKRGFGNSFQPAIDAPRILDQKGVIRPPRWLHHLKDQVLGQPGQCSQHTGGLRAEQGLAFQDLGHVSDIMKIRPMPFKVLFKLSLSSDVVSSSDS